jgi:hypothetical protein
MAGCSAAWLARLLWEQNVAGSNPATRIFALVTEWKTYCTQNAGFVGSTPTKGMFISVISYQLIQISLRC